MTRAIGLKAGLGILLGVLLGASAIAVGARFSFDLPGTPVPQSAQTLAVLLVGVVLGRVWGPVSVGVYLLAGALGLPAFADGKSGLGVLVGPTAGYLAGFLVAAWIAGAITQEREEPTSGRKFGTVFLFTSATAFAGMLLAHVVILWLGWLRLAVALGAVRAWEVGVAPFLVGGAVKSFVAAAVCRCGSDGRGGG